MAVPSPPAAVPGGLVEMKVRRLCADPLTELPVLLLEDQSGRETLAVPVGMGEAGAIASELSNVAFDRPLPHDLITSILSTCGARLERVELRELRRETLYATLVLRMPGGLEPPLELDARPSDAVALALRTGASIHVARRVLAKARRHQCQHQGRATSRAHGKARAYDDADTDGAWGEARVCDDAELGEGIDERFATWLLISLPDEDFGKWKM